MVTKKHVSRRDSWGTPTRKILREIESKLENMWVNVKSKRNGRLVIVRIY